MRLIRLLAGSLLAAVVLLMALIWTTTPRADVGQMRLDPMSGFTKGRYFAYVGPWGGLSMRLMRPWSSFSDHIVLDLKRFPAETRIVWRWPPFAPRNGPGVWGYDFVAYGDYATTPTEQPVKPVQVRDLKVLRQSFAWSMRDRLGGADVLTEFFLRANPTDEAAHRLEVGWFLHTPPAIRHFFEISKLVGTYTDSAGRRWVVRLSDRYCMFAPVTAGDIPAGEIDMLDALRWLQGRGLVHGDDWLWGVAIGVEPVTGAGELLLRHWQVAWQ